MGKIFVGPRVYRKLLSDQSSLQIRLVQLNAGSCFCRGSPQNVGVEGAKVEAAAARLVQES